MTRRSLFSRFPTTLIDEFHRSGIRVMFAGSRPDSSNNLFTTGLPDVTKLAKSLGNRWIGTIAILWNIHVHLPPEPQQWMRELAGPNHPFIWVDVRGSTHSEPFELLKLEKHIRKNCRRIFVDIPAAMKQCVDTLLTYGHRHVAIPFFTTPQTWQWSVERVQMIQEYAAQCTTPITVYAEDSPPDVWRKFLDMSVDSSRQSDFQLEILHPSRMSNEIDELVRHEGYDIRDGIRSESLLQATRKLMPFLYNVVTDKRITAIIAPNDRCACVLYSWLKKLGISIPGDISLISFDNYFPFNYLPLCSIDFGGAHLGYCAAHALIGDVPIGANRSGDIGSHVTVVNRGSLGIARTRA